MLGTLNAAAKLVTDQLFQRIKEQDEQYQSSDFGQSSF
jgi:hypothetical protein